MSLHVHIMKKGTVTGCSISHVGRVGGTEGSWTDGSALDCCVTLAESLSISGPGLTQLHSHSESEDFLSIYLVADEETEVQRAQRTCARSSNPHKVTSHLNLESERVPFPAACSTARRDVASPSAPRLGLVCPTRFPALPA